MAQRTYVVTGAASGVGAEAVRLLRQSGHRVFGVDLHDVEIVADLADEDGRQRFVKEVEVASGGVVDGVIACAGVLQETPLAVRVNFFGAVATLDGMRPLLSKSAAPRAVAVSSITSIVPRIDELVSACLNVDETDACAIAEREKSDYYPGNSRIYASTKFALSRWVKRRAVQPEWAGAGILLNAVAPFSIDTPMAQKYKSPDVERMSTKFSALGRPYTQPDEVAEVLVFLASPANSLMVGQTVYADAGFEAKARPEFI